MNIRKIINTALMIIIAVGYSACQKESIVDPPVITEQNIVTDIDGNVYNTVSIGSQVWMVENLKVTHYRNGDPISNVTGNSQWSNLSNGAYCNYDNDVNNSIIYGNLYNWYAVSDSRNIAPIGWHIPTDAEWNTLMTFLGGGNIAGGKMKETGTVHWLSPNTGADNSSTFTALPAGLRHYDGSFGMLGEHASFWTNIPYIYDIYSGSAVLERYDFSIKSGFSIRCIKD